MVSSTVSPAAPRDSLNEGFLGAQKLSLASGCRPHLTDTKSKQSMNASEFRSLTGAASGTCSTTTAPHPNFQNTSLTLLPRGPVGPYAVSQASASLFSYRNLNVYVVGDVGHPKASVIRVVHISDTRGVSDSYADQLPNGHILVHSGDFLGGPPARRSKFGSTTFGKYHKLRRLPRPPDPPEESSLPASEDWKKKLGSINEFFRRQPHPFKIFVSGCWDYFGQDARRRPSPREIQQHLPSAIYLEDVWCKVLGLKIYGIPWTSADDLRPQDGRSNFTLTTSRLSFQRFFSKMTGRHTGERRRYRCLSSCVGEKSRTCNNWNYARNSPSLSVCDGFVLPSIDAVSERYEKVPSDIDILVSHMPAWRPELYSQVVERIRPMLHLCGHDFAGYGVMWRQGVVFSNAALQLTASFPAVHRRRKAHSSSDTPAPTEGTTAATTGLLKFGASGASAPSQVTAPMPTVDSDPQAIFELPSGFREPRLVGYVGQRRPRRWRRRLHALLSRFSWRSPGGCGGGSGGGGRNSIFSRTGTRNEPTDLLQFKQTPSSVAALNVPFQVTTSSDEPVVYDPSMSASGSGILSPTSACRRSPAVFDVYVVIDDDRIILPDYCTAVSGKSGEPADENSEVISLRQAPASSTAGNTAEAGCPRRSACCIQ
nr:unnamed protein product [Spirometra erinaceieuropaei]